jgi:hypothetical protein
MSRPTARGASRTPFWQPSNTHIATGTRWYFAELNELSDFIRARLDAVSRRELDVSR